MFVKNTPLQSLDWNEILEKIKNYATSDLARTEVMQTQGFKQAEQAKQQMLQISSAQQVLNSGVRPFMESLDLFSTWFLRLKKRAVLKTLEIKDVRSFCLETLSLAEALKSVNSDWSQSVEARLMSAEEPLSAIDQILTPSGDIRSDASEKLYRLYHEKEKLARDLQQSLDRLVRDHDMEGVLQDKYVTTRDGRWVLPVRSGMQHHLPGVIHGSSQSKQTVFMEPEVVVPTNNRLRQIEVEIEDEIERLLTELSTYLSGQVDGFDSTRNALLETDVLFAKAQFSTMIAANPIHFSDESIELVDIKHPLLQLAASGKKPVVSNTVVLDQGKSILLLSGPNAGGKTVLLKSIGLAAQMARCGLPICASESSRLPFFQDILIGIGDAQSVDEELSTFAAHLKVLDQATKLKGRQNLIMIDEICGSTDPEEGSALARSFIENFSKNEIFAVITSHLGPLKAGWNEDSQVLNGSLEYDAKTGRPTYQYIAGVPGDSLAIQTAKRVGVSAALVERAIEILSPATRARLQGLEQIEQLKSDIATAQENLRKENQKAYALKKKYEGLLEEFKKEKDAWLEKSLKKAERKVEEAIAQAKVEDTFKRHRTLQEIKFQLPEIVKAKPAESLGAVDSAETFAARYPAGSKVFVPSLQQDAIVQSTPNSKGEVMVLSNSIRLQLPWQELRPAGKPVNPTSKLVRQSSRLTVALHESDRVLDLRGKTVDEALEELEVELDHAAAANEDRVKIIHGHGTEALKRAVRTYLSRSMYVKKWKAAPAESGGDGVTWVEISKD